jgi:hypothetical protein
MAWRFAFGSTYEQRRHQKIRGTQKVGYIRTVDVCLPAHGCATVVRFASAAQGSVAAVLNFREYLLCRTTTTQ